LEREQSSLATARLAAALIKRWPPAMPDISRPAASTWAAPVAVIAITCGAEAGRDELIGWTNRLVDDSCQRVIDVIFCEEFLRSIVGKILKVRCQRKTPLSGPGERRQTGSTTGPD
jgi:hypothetical protein